jgi:hypothetical protein
LSASLTSTLAAEGKAASDIKCAEGTTSPYVEVKVDKGLFIKTPQSEHEVSGGTKDAAKPFTFKLFDTGSEDSVTFDVWWSGNGEATKEDAEQVVGPEIRV